MIEPVPMDRGEGRSVDGAKVDAANLGASAAPVGSAMIGEAERSATRPSCPAKFVLIALPFADDFARRTGRLQSGPGAELLQYFVMERYDTVVLGLGAMGSARFTNWPKEDARFSPRPVLAAARVRIVARRHRITRLAIGEGEHYTPLVMRSHEIWREIKRETGINLLTITGAWSSRAARRPPGFMCRISSPPPSRRRKDSGLRMTFWTQSH